MLGWLAGWIEWDRISSGGRGRGRGRGWGWYLQVNWTEVGEERRGETLLWFGIKCLSWIGLKNWVEFSWQDWIEIENWVLRKEALLSWNLEIDVQSNWIKSAVLLKLLCSWKVLISRRVEFSKWRGVVLLMVGKRRSPFFSALLQIQITSCSEA